ncbi:MAG: hypothetical protein JO127_15435 [Caulobacteraceae bacterium]|nr:hypothetical protein [Caulobacteraceae bacterium]
MEISELRLDAAAPLVLVDADEVIALFMRGFESFLSDEGLEMRIDRFALFQNIYRPGEAAHIALEHGRALLHRFFGTGIEAVEPAPGAAEALRRLAGEASIVILTNAPPHSREPRARWLVKHGFDYPQVVNAGPKGPTVRALASLTGGRTAFVDDLLSQLDSAAEASPATARFQMVADERLRPLAPCAPDRHARIDDWEALARAIAAAIRG